MDNFRKLRHQVGLYTFLLIAVSYGEVLGLFYLAVEKFSIDPLTAALFCLPSSLILAGCIAAIVTHISLDLVRVIRQAVLHVTPQWTHDSW